MSAEYWIYLGIVVWGLTAILTLYNYRKNNKYLIGIDLVLIPVLTPYLHFKWIIQWFFNLGFMQKPIFLLPELKEDLKILKKMDTEFRQTPEDMLKEIFKDNEISFAGGKLIHVGTIDLEKTGRTPASLKLDKIKKGKKYPKLSKSGKDKTGKELPNVLAKGKK